MDSANLAVIVIDYSHLFALWIHLRGDSTVIGRCFSRLARGAVACGLGFCVVAFAQQPAPAVPQPNGNSKDALTLPNFLLSNPGLAAAMGGGGEPKYPPFEKVIEGYEKINSGDAATGQSLYTIYVRRRDGQALAVLPRDYAMQKYFFATTVAGGELFAGLQGGDRLLYWKQYDNRLALIEPNLDIRSDGDMESRSSVSRLFTDRVLVDIPILTMMPGGGPVIDLDELLVGNLGKFFGRSRFGGGMAGGNSRLTTIKTVKTFPRNVEISFEMPTGNGILKTYHYSISQLRGTPGFRPRQADDRVGYFTTTYSDYGKFKEDETKVRYIHRWHIEKADPRLKLSPPKVPIRFYIEHTTPVRYRRFVRQGIEYWNAAFEKIGIVNAIQVEQQDATTGAFMDKDPEDVNYNFVRWLSNNIGTAIGPSRANPYTGEILDADVVLTDGWIREFQKDHKLLPQLAMEGFSPETLAWLETRPSWDPRLLLAPPSQRNFLMAERAQRGFLPHGGHEMANFDPATLNRARLENVEVPMSKAQKMARECMAADGMAFAMSQLRLTLATIEEESNADDAKPSDDPAKKKDAKKDEKKDAKADPKAAKKGDQPKKPDLKAKDEEDKLDGIPVSFIGPLLADLVAHEIGHTLGLRHNFKASSVYTLDQINSPEIKGKKPFAGSVMDYISFNVNMKEKAVQGDYSMIGVGPYDMWAIEYGYTSSDNLKPILDRVAEPELAFATDEDTMGPDPLARRYDFSKNPLDFATSELKLARYHRAKLLDKWAKDGDSWAKVRKGYMLTLATQVKSISMMANWLGGAFVHRDHKGDPKARDPIVVVPAKDQRSALDFVIENSFKDDAFGLSQELLKKMTTDGHHDDEGFFFSMEEPTWPVHDEIIGIQSSALTMLMNPTTLRRVFDNEFRLPGKEDTLTLPELLEKLTAAIWTELKCKPTKACSARDPMVSSLRRNLQREHIDRLIDLIMPGNGSTAAYKPIANLASMQLRNIRKNIASALKEGGDKVDPYTAAHFADAEAKITKALEAQIVIDLSGGKGGFPFQFLFGRQANLGDANNCNCGRPHAGNRDSGF